MRLVTFEVGGVARIGALAASDMVVDLVEAAAIYYRKRGVEAIRSKRLAEEVLGRDMVSFIEAGAVAVSLAKDVLEEQSKSADYASVTHARSAVRLLAPVPKPGKVIGIGGNYPELLKTWPTPPKVPPMFQKARSCIIGPQDPIVIPSRSSYVQPELELVAVIGKTIRNIAEEDVWDAIAGYTIGNDLTAIDILMSNWVQRMRPDIVEYGLPGEAPFNLGLAFEAKSFDTFGVIGPWMVTPDEIEPTSRQLTLSLNGKEIQTGNTANMVVSIPRMIAFVSSVCTLEPGDLIFTGALNHLPPVRPGDVLTQAIDGIGSFDTKVIEEAAA